MRAPLPEAIVSAADASQHDSTKSSGADGEGIRLASGGLVDDRRPPSREKHALQNVSDWSSANALGAYLRAPNASAV